MEELMMEVSQHTISRSFLETALDKIGSPRRHLENRSAVARSGAFIVSRLVKDLRCVLY